MVITMPRANSKKNIILPTFAINSEDDAKINSNLETRI